MTDRRFSSYAEIDREAERLHEEGKRQEVVDLYRKYGLFTDEDVVERYLRGEEV